MSLMGTCFVGFPSQSKCQSPQRVYEAPCCLAPPPRSSHFSPADLLAIFHTKNTLCLRVLLAVHSAQSALLPHILTALHSPSPSLGLWLANLLKCHKRKRKGKKYLIGLPSFIFLTICHHLSYYVFDLFILSVCLPHQNLSPIRAEVFAVLFTVLSLMPERNLEQSAGPWIFLNKSRNLTIFVPQLKLVIS